MRLYLIENLDIHAQEVAKNYSKKAYRLNEVVVGARIIGTAHHCHIIINSNGTNISVGCQQQNSNVTEQASDKARVRIAQGQPYGFCLGRLGVPPSRGSNDMD